jgi:molecular chaperone DnaK
MVIQPSSGLSEAEIQRMIRDAEAHAAEDARRREEAELKNRADNLAYAAEQMLRERGESLPSDVKLELDNQAQAIRQALERNDIATIQSATEALERALQRASEAEQQPAGVGADGARGQQPSEGTVEGEFREV